MSSELLTSVPSAEIYHEILQFYAAQMSLLDGADPDPDGWVRTFTADAVLDSNLQDAPDIGHVAILGSLRDGVARIHAAGPLDIRHWLGMLDVRWQPDGSVRARSYAFPTVTPYGGPLALRGHVRCFDHLVRGVDGWRVCHRYLAADSEPR
ncbi:MULTISPECIES: nuclear transport factor 2 family protein [Frankia]|uniref:nuclear transport factor 2 family protein n=1 Tax=Frankia TaxID=1854 RepID=UPI0002EC37BC|nr:MULTISPECIES: nuclear transport factor 2 family protein [Frankia]